MAVSLRLRKGASTWWMFGARFGELATEPGREAAPASEPRRCARSFSSI